MKRFLPRLSYANVVATICLFLVLGGGAALAAGKLGKNSVGARQLKANSVTSAKVKDGSLRAGDLKAGTIPAPINAYTKPESDARYLRGTVTVITNVAKVTAGSFAGAHAECPPGFQAVGGGVNVSNVVKGWVSESAPSYNGEISFTQGPGQHGPATGWWGVVTSAGTEVPSGSEVIAVCAPIG
jgi:hypothetical protein